MPVDAVITRLTDDAGVLRAETFGTAVPGYRLDAEDTAEVRAHAFSAGIPQAVIGARPEAGESINQTGRELGSMGRDEEVAAYCITPGFGGVSRETAAQHRNLTGVYWRAALELGDACARLMQAEGIEKLDETVVQTAAAWMAGAGK